MAERIELKLDQQNLSILPGEEASIVLSVTNRSEVVDSYGLTVEGDGVSPSWYTLEQADVRLFPHDTAQIAMRVHAPQGSAAGMKVFQIRATSRDNPGDISLVVLPVSVAASGVAGMALGLVPKRVSGRKGLYAVTLTNPANLAVPIVLRATDPDEALEYSLGTPQTQPEGEPPLDSKPYEPLQMGKVEAQGEGSLHYDVELPATSSIVVPLLVKPRRAVWTGQEHPFKFQVGTNPPGVEWEPSEARRVDGELAYRPLLAAWAFLPVVLRRALMFGIPLLLLALILFQVSRNQSESRDRLNAARATQTALANQLSGQQASLQATLTAAAGGISAAQTAAAGGNSATQTAAAAGISGTQTAVAQIINNANAGGPGTSGNSANGLPLIRKFVLVVPPANGSGSTEPGGTGGPSTNGGVNSGTTPNLEWDVTAADSIRLLQASLPFPLGGLDTATQVDYQLVATNTTQVSTSTLSVLLIRPPTIGALDASGVTISNGQSTTISWQVRGARTATLDGAQIDLGPGGNGRVDLTPTTTHRYIFCASNQAGTICRSVKVTVVGANTPVPPTATERPILPPNTSTPTPTAIPTACGVDYTISQSTEATIVPGTLDIGNKCNECTTTIELPFQFRLYDRSFTSAIVGSNGTMGFVESSNPISNTCISDAAFDYTILPHWDDLTTAGTGLGIFTSVTGEAPERIFNIEWRAAFPTGGAANFQVRLFENSPVQQFDIIYGKVDKNGESATIGVQKAGNSSLTQYQCDSRDIESGMRHSYTLQCGPPGTPDSGGGRSGGRPTSCFPSTVDIGMRNDTFQPRNVVVNAGSIVRWINFDPEAHTTTGDGGRWNSGNMGRNQTFQVQFNTVGTFSYRSTTDPGMVGTITVVPACTPTPTLTQTPTRTATRTPDSLPPFIQGGCQSGLVNVSMRNNSFQPGSVMINAGSTVRWTNQDTIPHTTTSTTGRWHSGDVPQGRFFEFTFTLPGTYTYTSEGVGDEGMIGVVVVVASCTPTPTLTGTSTQTMTSTSTSSSTSTSTPTAEDEAPTRRPTRTPTPSCGDYAIIPSTGTIVPGTTSLGNNCDNCVSNLAIPFPVKVYDGTFTSARVSSNGAMQFSSSSTEGNNTCLPFSGFNYAILPHWDDLNTSCSGCGIFTSVSGTAPNRILNVEWRAQAIGSTGGQTQGPPTNKPGSGKPYPASPDDVAIPGSPINVLVRDSGSYSVARNNVAQFFGGYAEGAYLWVTNSDGGRTVWGPEQVPAGRLPNLYTPVSNVLTGNGSAGNPWRVNTALRVGTTGLNLNQQVSYVNGQDYIRNDWSICNTTTAPRNDVHLFHAADLYTEGNDLGYGYYDPASGAVGGYNEARTVYQIFSPITRPADFEEDYYSVIWSGIGDTAGPGPGFRNTVRANEFIDNGAGLEWITNIAPGACASIADFLSFSDRPVIPTTPVPSTVNFEVRLYENSPAGQFDIIYAQAARNGAGVTVGVQRATGNRSRQYSCDTASLPPNTKLTFYQQCPGTTTVTPTRTITSTTTATASITTTSTATHTITPTITQTPTETATETTTITPTLTSTETSTSTLTPTNSPTVTATATICISPNYTVALIQPQTIISGTNTVLQKCNECTATVPLPFAFTLYDQSFTSAIVGDNGTLGFLSNTNPLTNTCTLPSPAFNYAILPFWADLGVFGVGASVHTITTGAAPNRTHYIEWRYVDDCGSFSFEVALYETPPLPQAFDIIYGPYDGCSQLYFETIGIQEGTTGRSLVYACNLPDPLSFQRLRFYRPGCGTSTITPTTTRTITSTPTATASATVPPGPDCFWAGGNSLPSARFGNRGTGDSNYFYSVGGLTPLGGPNSFIHKYNLDSGTWITLTAMQLPVAHSAVITNSQRLYVFGGDNGGSTFTDALQIYNASTNSWSFGPTMPAQRSGQYLGINAGNIFVAGGRNDNFGSERQDNWRYNISGNSWFTMTQMPAPSAQGSSVTYGGRMYTFGGSRNDTPHRDVRIYDMVANTWSTGVSMTLALSGTQASVIDNEIYVYGGDNGSTVVNTTQIYNPLTNSWRAGPNLIQARADFAGGPVNVVAMAAGGLASFGSVASSEYLLCQDFGTPGTTTATVTSSPTSFPGGEGNGCLANYTVRLHSDAQVANATNRVLAACDECAMSIPLPFPYTFYDRTFNSVWAGDNGTMGFDGNNNPAANTCSLPSASFRYAILPHWDDLSLEGPGCATGYCGIYTLLYGDAPNRTFSIVWNAVRNETGGAVRFEVRLYERQRTFDVIYGRDLDGRGESAMVGIQTGTSGPYFTQVSCGPAGIAPGMRLTFDNPGCSTPTATPTWAAPSPTNTPTQVPSQGSPTSPVKGTPTLTAEPEPATPTTVPKPTEPLPFDPTPLPRSAATATPSAVPFVAYNWNDNDSGGRGSGLAGLWGRWVLVIQFVTAITAMMIFAAGGIRKERLSPAQARFTVPAQISRRRLPR